MSNEENQMRERYAKFVRGMDEIIPADWIDSYVPKTTPDNQVISFNYKDYTKMDSSKTKFKP